MNRVTELSAALAALEARLNTTVESEQGFGVGWHARLADESDLGNDAWTSRHPTQEQAQLALLIYAQRERG